MDSGPLSSFSSRTRWSIRLNVAVAILSFVTIVVLSNYLANRYFQRFDVGRRVVKELTPLTLRVLQGLTNRVEVIVLFSHKNDLYDPVVRLLRQYELHSPRVALEVVNYVRDPGRARAVERAYLQGTSEGGDRIIFASEGRVKVVGERALSEYKDAVQELLADQEVTRTGFRAEGEFTSAIFSVSDPNPKKAYFLSGHGEHDPTDGDGQAGYGRFARILAESNVELHLLQLGTESIPKDCQLLIMAGPVNRLPQGELDEIDAYLKRGGRVLALLRYNSIDARGFERTDLDLLLANWGIEVGRDMVVDHLQGRSSSREEVLVMEYGSHPVVNPLRNKARIRLAVPRSIGPRAAAEVDGPRVLPLLLTSPQARSHPVAGTSSPSAAASGRMFSLGVAAEKGSLQGVSDRGIPRLVVLGDSYCFGNQLIQDEANRDLARNCVNWLVSHDVWLEGIGPRPMDEYRLSLSGGELRAIRWTLLAGLPGAALTLGMMTRLRRRS